MSGWKRRTLIWAASRSQDDYRLKSPPIASDAGYERDFLEGWLPLSEALVNEFRAAFALHDSERHGRARRKFDGRHADILVAASDIVHVKDLGYAYGPPYGHIFVHPKLLAVAAPKRAQIIYALTSKALGV